MGVDVSDLGPQGPWADAIVGVLQSYRQWLEPAWQACCDADIPALAQIANQIRNAVAHLDWSVAIDIGPDDRVAQVRKARDHVDRATLDCCKLLWEHRSSQVLPGQKELARAHAIYADLVLMPFSDGNTLYKWSEFLDEFAGVTPFVIDSERSVTMSDSLAAGWPSLTAEWRSVRRADADLMACTLRLPEDGLSWYMGLWHRYVAAMTGQALRVTCDHGQSADAIEILAGSVGPMSFLESVQLVEQAYCRIRDAWRIKVVSCLLADPDIQEPIKCMVAGALFEDDQGDAAFITLSDMLPGYPLRMRDQAANKLVELPGLDRPVIGRPRLPADVDGIVWFCDLCDSTASGDVQEILLKLFDGVAQAVVPAKKAGLLLATNTWGDAAMVACSDVAVGFDSLRRFVAIMQPVLSKHRASMRVGCAAGRIVRQSNPITLYDVTGETVVVAARLEPCAPIRSGQATVVAMPSIRRWLAGIPGIVAKPCRGIVAKSFRIGDTRFSKSHPIELVELIWGC